MGFILNSIVFVFFITGILWWLFSVSVVSEANKSGKRSSTKEPSACNLSENDVIENKKKPEANVCDGECVRSLEADCPVSSLSEECAATASSNLVAGALGETEFSGLDATLISGIVAHTERKDVVNVVSEANEEDTASPADVTRDAFPDTNLQHLNRLVFEEERMAEAGWECTETACVLPPASGTHSDPDCVTEDTLKASDVDMVTATVVEAVSVISPSDNGVSDFEIVECNNVQSAEARHCMTDDSRVGKHEQVDEVELSSSAMPSCAGCEKSSPLCDVNGDQHVDSCKDTLLEIFESQDVGLTAEPSDTASTVIGDSTLICEGNAVVHEEKADEVLPNAFCQGLRSSLSDQRNAAASEDVNIEVEGATECKQKVHETLEETEVDNRVTVEHKNEEMTLSEGVIQDKGEAVDASQEAYCSSPVKETLSVMESAETEQQSLGQSIQEPAAAVGGVSCGVVRETPFTVEDAVHEEDETQRSAERTDRLEPEGNQDGKEERYVCTDSPAEQDERKQSDTEQEEEKTLSAEERLRWIKKRAIARVYDSCRRRRRQDEKTVATEEGEVNDGWESEEDETGSNTESSVDEEDGDTYATPNARLEATDDLKTKGNDLFKDREYSAAVNLYTDALKICPTLDLGAVLLCNRAACFLLMKQYQEVIADCSDAVELDPTYVKIYLRRFRANEALQKWHDALADLNKALELDPSLRPTYALLHKKIERESQEQFEREKKEMIDKLKTFGNWALGKVGLSIDNFKLEQNPETGAYNISFQNNSAN